MNVSNACCAGHWAKGSLEQAYIEKNPLAALQAFAIASGWEQSSFMRRHFLGRALVSTIVHVHLCKQKVQKRHTSQTNVKQNFNSFFATLEFIKFPVHLCLPAFSLKKANTWLMLQVPVPAGWVDAIFPRVRALLDTVQARNARMQSGKCQADDLISDKAAEGFLQTVLYSGICFWQNLPFRTQR